MGPAPTLEEQLAAAEAAYADAVEALADKATDFETANIVGGTRSAELHRAVHALELEYGAVRDLQGLTPEEKEAESGDVKKRLMEARTKLGEARRQISREVEEAKGAREKAAKRKEAAEALRDVLKRIVAKRAAGAETQPS